MNNNKVKNMAATNALLGLWAETSIHAGSGSSVDGVDLPIQRESHSGWPCVFGSAVKGALRAKAEDKWGKNDSVRFVFGPDSDSVNASEQAGALMVGDARLLLLPVRSLTGHFKWVTCPALLERLLRDARRLGVPLTYSVPKIDDDETVLQAKAGGEHLFLEEYCFTPKAEQLEGLIKVLSGVSSINSDDLTKQLAIISDDMFSYLSEFATPVTAHIAIDNDKKTVKTGALWYEETLPAETVFYCTLSANRVRSKDKDIQKQWQADAILKCITEDLFAQPAYLQVGGNETLGMGWCKVTVKEA
jgi:CRISPR-associated protein Cmr4